MINNALWIPEFAVELQLRLCVEAHCRSAGYRAYEATLGAVLEYVALTTMAKDVKVFVQNCLHCVATVPGDKVPRPLRTQLHAIKPNEILHFDFLYIGLSRDEKYQYLLLLKNDLFESSHGKVLCVAKDETFVDFIRRRLCCNFLRKSRL
jgi:Integrase zinc binding domain